MKQLPVAISLLALCGPLLSVAESVPLADASASASVQTIASPEGFAISVSFRPVTTLDEISNEEMTEVLAQFYAEEALSTFLQSQKGIDFVKAKAANKPMAESRVQWAFAVPAGAVVDAEIEVVEMRRDVVGKKPAEARLDAKTRLLDFRSSCFRDLRIAESLFIEEAEKSMDDQAREKLRRRIESALAALREKIKADDDLFRAEKKELLEKVGKVESFLLREVLDEADGDVERGEDKNMPIKEAIFIAPFDKILADNPIMLQHDGARSVMLGNGKIAIIAVGSARADNDDREDIAKMMASAELAKYMGSVETAVNNLSEWNYRRSNGNAASSEKSERKMTKKTTVNAIDFHKQGDNVGTWLSKDGKRFFMAFGRIVKQREDNE